MENSEDLKYFRTYTLDLAPRAIVSNPVTTPYLYLEDSNDLLYYRTYLAKVA